MKPIYLIPFLAMLATEACSSGQDESPADSPVIAAYVYYNHDRAINAAYVNQIIYSYFSVSDSLTTLIVNNPERLQAICDLKKDYPSLKILGCFGAPAKNLSLAFRSDSLRAMLIDDSQRILKEYDLDGYDIDWEWPGRGEWALSLEEETDNFVKALSDLRAAMGPDKLLTIAVAPRGYGVDFERMTPLVDQYNLMNYDLGYAPTGLSTPLFHSDKVNWLTGDDGVCKFIENDVPASKIIYGLAFYGHGCDAFEDFTEWRDISVAPDMTVMRDTIAGVPYIVDKEGKMILTYDDPESLTLKCRYAREKNLGGVMYWRFETDDDSLSLSRAVHTAMLEQ